MVWWILQPVDESGAEVGEATNVGDALFAARTALSEVDRDESKYLLLYGSPRYRLTIMDLDGHELANLTLEEPPE